MIEELLKTWQSKLWNMFQSYWATLRRKKHREVLGPNRKIFRRNRSVSSCHYLGLEIPQLREILQISKRTLTVKIANRTFAICVVRKNELLTYLLKGLKLFKNGPISASKIQQNIPDMHLLIKSIGNKMKWLKIITKTNHHI